jgi:serine/threonine protein kinase
MPVAPDLVGVALDDRYELHAVLGDGAFGRVYRGVDRRLARTVAVKVIKPWWSEDPEWVEAFEREAQLLARVSDPGIVQIFDVGHAAEGLYYVSELVEGESLHGLLKRGPVEPGRAARLAEQLCRGLAQAHAQRIIHRDVKPANILISRDGRVKVGDFGVARLAEATSDGALATIVGTPRYMAPEQGSGGQTTPATDVYSAGIVLYEMLAGAPPFTGSSLAELALNHLHDPPPPLPDATPPALRDVVAKALAKDPAERYQDAGEMADALARSRRPSPVRRVGPEPTRRRRSERARLQPPRPDRRDRNPPDSTMMAPARPPVRRFNPAARRRTVAAFTLIVVVLAAMVALAAVIGDGSSTTAKKPRRHHHHAPTPVTVLNVVSESGHDAALTLERAGLRPRILIGPDPGGTPGIVYRQVPPARAAAAPHSIVTLYVAERPRWQPAVVSFSGSGAARSAAFTIRGDRWRIVYSMHYGGTCAFLFFGSFCSGPTVRAVNTATGAQVASLQLNPGDRQSQVVSAGPGTFELLVTPGDSAGFKLSAQDWY